MQCKYVKIKPPDIQFKSFDIQDTLCEIVCYVIYSTREHHAVYGFIGYVCIPYTRHHNHYNT